MVTPLLLSVSVITSTWAPGAKSAGTVTGRLKVPSAATTALPTGTGTE